MKAWRVHRHGSPSEALVLDDVAEPQPGPGEIRVRTTATTLNFNEVDGCRGRYRTVDPPLPYTLGMEGLGTVDAAGPQAEHWLGRRVVATATGAFGAHAEAVVGPATMAFDAPDGLDDVAAAAVFFPFHLAWLGLHERARLLPGETVLVHAAAGGVGSAAVQLSVDAGARVIATAGGPDKLALARSLGAEVLIDYRTDDIVAAVDDATAGLGVDVVFDGVGGAVRDASLRALGRNGRYLVVGFADGIETEDEPGVTPRTLCFGNYSMCGVMLSYAADPLPARRHRGFNLVPRSVGDTIHAAIVERLGSGALRPVVGAVVGRDDLPAALDAMERRETTGRTVVRW
jgi:NADPH2:quinone reductase